MSLTTQDYTWVWVGVVAAFSVLFLSITGYYATKAILRRSRKPEVDFEMQTPAQLEVVDSRGGTVNSSGETLTDVPLADPAQYENVYHPSPFKV